MNSFTISSIFVAFSSGLVCFYLLYKTPKNAINRLYSLVGFTVMLWGIAGYMFSRVPESQYELAFFWWQFGYIGVIFVPAFFAHYVFRFLGLKRRVLMTIVYLMGLFFVFLNWFYPKLFLADLKFVFHQFYWHDWTIHRSLLYLIFYISFFNHFNQPFNK